MLKSKIHRATVTGASIDYEGSITLDPDLMAAADLLPFEMVHVLDLDIRHQGQARQRAGGHQRRRRSPGAPGR